MTPAGEQLRTRYQFRDFLFYTALFAVPPVTALLAISRASAGWLLVYLAVCLAMVAVILKFFCTRCPHYTRGNGKLKCVFFWGLPKFFAPRPGALNTRDKAAAFIAPAVIVLFPLYWLLQQPGLLVIYILSASVAAAALQRMECDRCVYFECPANRVPEDQKPSP
jgi:hypothetical protein